MSSVTFTPQTGYFAYRLLATPAYTTGNFSIGFFNTELTPTTRIALSGVSGKLFDQDSNYIHSYNINEELNISGNVFTGKHNIFINEAAKNLNCSRLTGNISGFSITDPNFTNISLIIRS